MFGMITLFRYNRIFWFRSLIPRDRNAVAKVAPIYWWVVALSFLVCATASYAERFVQIAAEIQIYQATWRQTDTASALGNKAGSTNQWSVSFVCTVGTNKWQLDGNFSKNARHKWFFDGTNVFNSIQITEAPDERLATNRLGFMFPPLERVRSNLTINVHELADGYPLGDLAVNIPWLAFCSGTYLKRSGRIVPLPVAIIGHAPDVFAYSDETETFDDDLGLPRTVQLFTSQSLHEKSVREVSKAMAKRAPKPTLQDGLRKFHYRVTQSTNYLGWTFPLTFEFAEDKPQELGNVLRSHRGTGRARLFTDSFEPQGVFDVSLKQTVVDRRFRSDTKSVNSILYYTTNSFLLPTNDPALQANYAAHVRRAPPPPAVRKRRARLVVWTLFVLAAAVPVAGMLLRKKQKHN